MKELSIKNYPKFIQDTHSGLNFFGKVKFRLWLLWLRITGKVGWTQLEYRGMPIIEDGNENTND